MLHSWTGIVLALMIYIVCASGTVALFVHDIELWQHPELQRAPASGDRPVNLEGALAEARRAGLVSDRATFQLPHHTNAVMLRIPDDSGRVAFFDPASGALRAIRQEGFGRMLRVLHSDLLLPFPVGAFLTGFLGITLLFLVVTGVVTHRRFYRELFTLRTGRSWRLSWSDLHKLAGAWGMAFLAMMSFSGSIFGLAGLLLLQTAVVAHRGDAAQASKAIGGFRQEASGVQARLGPLAPMLAQTIGSAPFSPRYVTISHIGDEKSTVMVEGERPDYLSDAERKVFDRHGRLLAVERGVNEGAGWRVYSALLPLHFGNYGGAALKLVYLLLGLAACLMPVSGIWLWLDRHRRGNTLGRGHFLMRGMASGVIVGFPIGIAGLFIAARLIPVWMAQAGNPALVLLTVWVGVLGVSLLLARRARLEQALVSLAGGLFLLVPFVNGWVTGDFLLFALGGPLRTSHLVDAVLLACAIGLLGAARRMQKN